MVTIAVLKLKAAPLDAVVKLAAVGARSTG
jgi:hypothetical protein